MSFADAVRMKAVLKQLPIKVTFSAASTSSVIEVGEFVPRGLAVEIPVGWTSASLGIQVSRENSLWMNLFDQNGARLQITNISTTVRQVYITPPEAWGMMRYPYLRLFSQNSGTGVNQNNTVFVSILA